MSIAVAYTLTCHSVITAQAVTSFNTCEITFILKLALQPLVKGSLLRANDGVLELVVDSSRWLIILKAFAYAHWRPASFVSNPFEPVTFSSTAKNKVTKKMPPPLKVLNRKKWLILGARNNESIQISLKWHPCHLPLK
ncbi:hypothetical protein [Paraglaciecola aestuariivivens]